MESKKMLKEQLLYLEEKLLKPEIRTSQKELGNILADSFFEFGSSGKVLYKDENITGETLNAVNMKLSSFEIYPISEDIVLATYRIFNEETKQHSLRSSVWKYSDERWQMFFHQGTKTDAPF